MKSALAQMVKAGFTDLSAFFSLKLEAIEKLSQICHIREVVILFLIFRSRLSILHPMMS